MNLIQTNHCKMSLLCYPPSVDFLHLCLVNKKKKTSDCLFEHNPPSKKGLTFIRWPNIDMYLVNY